MNKTQGKPVKWWPTMVGAALPYVGYGAYTLYQNRQQQQRRARIDRQVRQWNREREDAEYVDRAMRRAERQARHHHQVPTVLSGRFNLRPQHSQADIQADLRQREAEL